MIQRRTTFGASKGCGRHSGRSRAASRRRARCVHCIALSPNLLGRWPRFNQRGGRVTIAGSPTPSGVRGRPMRFCSGCGELSLVASMCGGTGHPTEYFCDDCTYRNMARVLSLGAFDWGKRGS